MMRPRRPRPTGQERALLKAARAEAKSARKRTRKKRSGPPMLGGAEGAVAAGRLTVVDLRTEVGRNTAQAETKSSRNVNVARTPI